MMNLSMIGLLVLFLGATFALTYGAYFLARWCLIPRVNEQARELASSVIFRVAALHGLILALVFAEELGNSDALIESLNREANLLESIYFDAGRHGGERTGDVKEGIAFYVHEVLEHEWDLLGNQGQLSNEAWGYREIALGAVLDLEDSEQRQSWLKHRMLEQMAAVETERNNREIIAATDINMLFWIVAFIGVALVSAPYFAFSPNTANLTLLAMYAAYTGLALFFIYALDNPFASFGGVRPVALELLYNEFLSEIVAGASQPPVDGGS
jgi:hypothetical protein